MFDEREIGQDVKDSFVKLALDNYKDITGKEAKMHPNFSVGQPISGGVNDEIERTLLYVVTHPTDDNNIAMMLFSDTGAGMVGVIYQPGDEAWYSSQNGELTENCKDSLREKMEETLAKLIPA